MRNPLNKRILREIKSEWKKYVALFLLLTLTIGFVSGMFVANDSMETAAYEAYDKYNIEDGHFELKDKPTDELLEDFEDEDIKIYEQYYKDFDEDFNADGETDAKIRVFKVREDIDRACLMEGEMPEKENEIAIDRMHADNSKISVGDTISIGDYEMKVTALVAFSDYSTLYEDNSDIMFDALTFDVGAVTPEGYDALNAREVYQYAFQYNDEPEDEEEQKEKSDILSEQLAVLSLTGGMLDDTDEAEKFSDEVEADKEFLEEMSSKADELKQRGEELEKKTASMSPEEQMASMAELQKEADDIQKEADELKKQEDKINETADRLKELEKYEEHINELTDFVPEYANRAIHFAVEDFGSDKAMGEEILIILIIVIAFIFAITASNTIVRESAVIGTLRASGYKKGELLIHYVSVPVFVTFMSALIGNILGYTYFKNVVVDMYYNSYSLPTYVTLWNADAFVKTTIYPVLIMIVVNILVVNRKLKLSPLKFLRHDLSKSNKKKAMKLPRWKFLTRFRLRIFFQNMVGYVTLFLGIFFVMILLAFSVGMPATLDNYQENASSYIVADYQYVLKGTEDSDGNEITTKEKTAEKYSINSLKTVDGVHVGEEITVFGYMDDSRYFEISEDLEKDEVYITKAYADKFNIKEGQSITLKDMYKSKKYKLKVEGIYDLPGTLGIMLPNDRFNKMFNMEAGSFTGYLSEKEIKDIDEDMIYSVMTVDDALKIVNQLNHSMGGYMKYFSAMCMIIALIIILLLTKIIIESSAVSISMVKVLGYSNREINSLYVRITTTVVILSSVITAFASELVVAKIWANIMYRMNGWFEFYIGIEEIIRIILMVIVTYVLVAILDIRRIKRIPMTEALKNIE